MKKVQIIEKSCHREALKVERVRNYFQANDYEIIPDNVDTDPTDKYAFPLDKLEIDPTADIIILTTCGFTQEIEDGDFEALEVIKKHKKPSAQIILAGCINEIAPERVDREFDGPKFDSRSYYKLDEIVKPEKNVSFEDVPEPNRMKNTDKYFIQIQEGCNNRCSFCAIWKTIGPSTSKPKDDVMKEFYRGLNAGCKEFYLLGHCAGAYGSEFRENLGILLDNFISINRDFTVVLEDISPKYMIKFFDQLKKLCSQKKVESFHSPIQSGNDRILRLMNRKFDMNLWIDMFKELREVSPTITLSSSAIVGFPSETREELFDTINVMNKATIDTSACHMFSPREGAKAAEMPDQISLEEKVERFRIFKDNLNGETRIDPNQRKYFDAKYLLIK